MTGPSRAIVAISLGFGRFPRRSVVWEWWRLPVKAFLLLLILAVSFRMGRGEKAMKRLLERISGDKNR